MRIALASLEANNSGRNPVLAYANGYRDMAKQGVESIPVWSVITDLERNIAPLFTAPPVPIVPDYTSFEKFWSSFKHPFADDDKLKSFAVENGLALQPGFWMYLSAISTRWMMILQKPYGCFICGGKCQSEQAECGIPNIIHDMPACSSLFDHTTNSN
ncbi:hypothetical protein [Trabulsiella guamensis]|uniref:hypothetical protein n=1 Tax=Trabulsiella guamensis TaxID=158852 RepID=UPI000AEBCFFF|nr:hypothetical protein [Trabulsiella guamensis]